MACVICQNKKLRIMKVYTPKTSISISLKLGLGGFSSHVKSRVHPVSGPG
jgi:hypothetical protein